jgi:hypothetical protein
MKHVCVRKTEGIFDLQNIDLLNINIFQQLVALEEQGYF